MINGEKTVILLGAMQAEHDAVVEQMIVTHRYNKTGFAVVEGNLFGKPCVAALSGVGKIAAAVVSQFLMDEYKPCCVLFTGVGGALNPGYEIGDVVLATDCVQHDMDGRGLGFDRGQIPYTAHRFFESDAHLINIAMQTPIDYAIHTGRILTGDQFITDKHHPLYAYLSEELKGDVVDMEGAAVAYACKIHKTPFLLIRTISDKANNESPNSFEAFLPVVAGNSLAIIHHIFNHSTFTFSS